MLLGAGGRKKSTSRGSCSAKNDSVVSALKNMICPLRLGEFSSVTPQFQQANQQLAKPLVPEGSRAHTYMESRARTRSERTPAAHRFINRRGTQGRIQDLQEIGDEIQDMGSKIHTLRTNTKAFGTNLGGLVSSRLAQKVKKDGGTPGDDRMIDLASYVLDTTHTSAPPPRPRATQRRSVDNRASQTFLNSESKFEDLGIDNIHEANQVCSIPSERRRVEKKIEYYKEMGTVLVTEPIEKHYMVVDPVRNAELVNVDKLKSVRELGCHSPGLHSPRSKSPMRSKSPPTSSGLQNLTLTKSLQPKAVAEKLRETAEQHAQRVQHAIQCARDTALEKRMKAWRILDFKDRRRDIASGQRLWLMCFVVASAAKEMEHTLEICKQLREESATLQSPRRSRMQKLTGQMISQQNSIGLGSVRGSHKILTVIESVHKQYKESRQQIYQKQLNASWYHLLRVLKAIIRFRKPLRLNRKAELIKSFIEASWRGYFFRREIKHFLGQVRFLQRAMRSCVEYNRLVRKRFILPRIWEQETRILGEVVGMDKNAMYEIIEHQMNEVFEMDKWIVEAKKLNDNRELLWRGKVSMKTINQVEAGEKRKRLKTGATKSLSMRLKSSKTKGLAGVTPLQVKAGSTPPASPSNTPPTSPRAIKKKEVGAQKKNSMMEVIEQYRLPEEKRHDLARQIWKDNSQRWWRAYLSYKLAIKEYQAEWHSWRLSCLAIGKDNMDIWPPIPLIPWYPYELTKVDQGHLRPKVTKMLRHDKAAQLLK